MKKPWNSYYRMKGVNDNRWRWISLQNDGKINDNLGIENTPYWDENKFSIFSPHRFQIPTITYLTHCVITYFLYTPSLPFLPSNPRVPHVHFVIISPLPSNHLTSILTALGDMPNNTAPNQIQIYVLLIDSILNKSKNLKHF